MNAADQFPLTAAPAAAPGPLARLAHPFVWIARRERLACAVVLFLTLGIRATLLPWDPVPVPAIHDEMSYLLAGDTYASGRLANPPHAFWEHFETFHVLQQPVYASKYQPLQGLVLAFGQKFFGQPWAGVYFSAGLMCAAMCWMLQGWIEPELALLGAIIFMLRAGIFGYWMNSYWGGAVPAIGGALALGAVARIWRRRQLGHSATWALGLAILMHSRPYDAALIGLLSGALLVWALRKNAVPFRISVRQVAIPALAILFVSLALVGYYDYRLTGSATTLPFQLFDKQYVVAPMFSFLPLRPEPVYRHAAMHQFFAIWNVELWNTARKDFVNSFLANVGDLYAFFFGLWPLLIPPLIWPYPLKTAEEKAVVVLLVASVLLGIGPLIGSQPHYAAAAAGLFYLRFLQTIARLKLWRPGGKPIGAGVALVFLALIGYQFTSSLSILFRYGTEISKFGLARAEVLQDLRQRPGKQLVLVRYAPDHRMHDEWVQNAADIDASRIVWAYEMGVEQDRPLIGYYRDRQVWLLEPDRSPPKLAPYNELAAH
ncbi:MAG TPA: hypothetical protein VGN17_14060 [Bryobacteraceae bacterium]|jgi:hypothetical protein